MFEEILMFKLVRSLAVCASLLALGACQTTSINSNTVSKIQAAGYEQVTSIPVNVGTTTGVAAYLCSPAKCGNLRVIVVNSVYGNSDSLGQNLETQVRKAGNNPAKMQREFARGFAGTSPSRKISSMRYYSSPTHAGIIATGSDVTPRGNLVYYSGRVAFRGNTASATLGLSDNPASARSAMNLALED
jgi:hypothetical protein